MADAAGLTYFLLPGQAIVEVNAVLVYGIDMTIEPGAALLARASAELQRGVRWRLLLGSVELPLKTFVVRYSQSANDFLSVSLTFSVATAAIIAAGAAQALTLKRSYDIGGSSYEDDIVSISGFSVSSYRGPLNQSITLQGYAATASRGELIHGTDYATYKSVIGADVRFRFHPSVHILPGDVIDDQDRGRMCEVTGCVYNGSLASSGLVDYFMEVTCRG